ncbi:MAG TPA: hypothetical protein VFA45_06555, partial [Actinomycetes bacterium]|nr:hypothetical protein [Actinomycetes bacterium]
GGRDHHQGRRRRWGANATARLAVCQRSASGDWQLLGQRLIGKAGGWYWYVLTGPARCAPST